MTRMTCMTVLTPIIPREQQVQKAHEEERSVDFETKNEADLKKWTAALQHLIDWRKSQKEYAGRLAGAAVGDDMEDLSDFDDSDAD